MLLRRDGAVRRDKAGARRPVHGDGGEECREEADIRPEGERRRGGGGGRRRYLRRLIAEAAARASERPIVELETLQKCNDRLISSIAEVITIHEEGMLRRRQAQDALVKIEQDLKAALLSTT